VQIALFFALLGSILVKRRQQFGDHMGCIWNSSLQNH
jgi:hypothetical protein